MRDCDHEELIILGWLGSVLWGRCRYCGQDQQIASEEEPEDANGWDD